MRSWHQALSRSEATGEPYVLVTVLATTGSAPRGSSTKMVVTATGSYDTIGGGRLEHLVQARARELLAGRSENLELQHYPLAATAEQCCGGSVTVLLEPRGTKQQTLWLFGAGHVGQRVAQLVAELPYRLRWIDNRTVITVDDERLERVEDPVATIDAVKDEDAVVIVTHDHDLDYRLVTALLAQTQCGSIGLIGSTTKAERFATRLERNGFDASARARLRCPIGGAVGQHKEPMAIAVAIVAELLERKPASAKENTVSWQQLKLSLVGQSQPAPAGKHRP